MQVTVENGVVTGCDYNSLWIYAPGQFDKGVRVWANPNLADVTDGTPAQSISYIQDGFLIILPVMKKFVKTKLRATYGDGWISILSQRGIEIHRESNYQINANNPEEVFDSADLNSTVFMLTSGSMWNTDFRKCGISKAYIQELPRL